MSIVDRTKMTFAQAEGRDKLPQQLQPRQISAQLSAFLWAVFDSSIKDSLWDSNNHPNNWIYDDPWKNIFRSWWIGRLFENSDELPTAHRLWQLAKDELTSRDYVKVFDFIQWTLRHPDCPSDLAPTIADVLSGCRSAYRLVDDTILPLSTDEEAEAIGHSLKIAAKMSAAGPSSHLKNATRALSEGRWSESIRESIHAVEGAGKAIEPTAKTLGPALAKLRTTIGLNSALATAFGNLYGYTSDQKGVRHSLVFSSTADVGERDALFMFGACAAFVAYLASAESALDTAER